eukprot:CAMPEP_0115641580 /NCGR_PEP_ID=MMETSP0272-20121206/36386_1 /TAXON_ID=71861 /ORGANISM="Scrippsiella trochoidea, Strain CCMP3099" /LENGTH=48 /DNA_ID= /DNA_START= /DNA_END= /DNA_ORIENTATION=
MALHALLGLDASRENLTMLASGEEDRLQADPARKHVRLNLTLETQRLE